MARVGLFVLDEGNYEYLPGKIANNTIVATTRKFGNFILGQDTTPPAVTFLHEDGNSSLVRADNSQVMVEVSDTGAGIDKDSIVATVDGTTVVTNYDEPNGIVRFEVPQRNQKDDLTVTFEVKDYLENSTVLQGKRESS